MIERSSPMRLISDFSIKQIDSDFLIFKRFGKCVCSLEGDTARLFQLYYEGKTRHQAESELGLPCLQAAEEQLRDQGLLAPDVLPRIPQDQLTRIELANEVLVYHPVQGTAMLLNQTIAALLPQCDGETTVELAIDALSKKFEIAPDTAEELLWASLKAMRDRGLFLAPLHHGLSRRAFLSRWAAAAALFPVIVSAAAPHAAVADSTTCIVNGDAGCQALFPGSTRVFTTCCPCTANATPPCPGDANCQRPYLKDGNNCLDDTPDTGGLTGCFVYIDSGHPFANAQDSCADARNSTQADTFGGYACCRCP
ncbi:MAG: PqqD family protein [Vulcanimicrobiota bacterium]